MQRATPNDETPRAAIPHRDFETMEPEPELQPLRNAALLVRRQGCSAANVAGLFRRDVSLRQVFDCFDRLYAFALDVGIRSSIRV